MKTLKDGYFFLFFRLWRWHKKFFGESDLPHLNATLHLGLLMFLNLIMLALLTRWATGFRLTSWSQTESIIAVGIVGIIQYSLFFYDGRYLRIIKRFQEENAEVSRATILFGNAYMVFTFVGLIVSGFLSWGIDRR